MTIPPGRSTQGSRRPSVDLDELYVVVNDDPVRGRALVDPLISVAVREGDDCAAALTLRLRGLAELYLDRIDQSVASLDDALRHARRAGAAITGVVQMTRAGVLSWAGRPAAARAAIDEAVATLEGVERARALVQRGTIRYREGAFEAALADFAMAEPDLESGDDQLWLANLATNRGIVWGYLGEMRRAEIETRRAVDIFSSLELDLAGADAVQNLGWAALRLGDLPAAFRWFDDAERRFGDLGAGQGPIWGDRSEALLVAFLPVEAAAYARRAVAALDDAGLEADAAEVLLRLAEAELLAGRPDDARSAAEDAATRFGLQDRSAWRVNARYLRFQAMFAAGDVDGADLDAVRGLANELETIGLREATLHTRILAGRIALAAGDGAIARIELGAAAAARSAPSVRLRAQAWLAEATLRATSGDRRGAMRAAAAGLDSIEMAYATVGASDTRAHLAAHGDELGRLGLGLALETGRNATIFSWIERTRANALRFPPARPPDDAVFAAELAQLRGVEADLREATLCGGSTRDLERRASRLRTSIRRHRMGVSGSSGPTVGRPPALAAVRATLADHAILVQIGGLDGSAFTISVSSGGASRRSGFAVTEVSGALDALAFGMSRLAQGRGSATALAVAEESVAEICTTLGDRLLPVLGDDVSEVVVVPPAALHAVPWGLLPSLRGKAITVTPSVGLWMKRSTQPSRIGRVVVAHGPDLPGASDETRRVADLYADVTRFTARTSKVDDVLAALDGAALAHIVSHGTFRGDNPLFSSLRLADGALTVYDLERVQRLPDVVVLSACNSGIQAVRPGDETMGIVAGLLGAGVRTVIASTGLVPDTSRTATTMVDLHRRLVAGEPPAVALAAAQETARRRIGPAGAPFVCFGAG